jgi:hypothetical protein
MPQVGFELTIPVFERVKTVHALDCAATVISLYNELLNRIYLLLYYTTGVDIAQSV